MKNSLLIAFVVVLVWFGVAATFGPVGLFQNSWSTNRPPRAVEGVDNLQVTNRGSGTGWLFYAVGPNTIARLTDITNAGNANYILAQAGNGNVISLTNSIARGTHFSVDGQLRIGSDPISIDDIGGVATIGGGTSILLSGPVAITDAQTNWSDLDVAGAFTAWGGATVIGGLSTDQIDVSAGGSFGDGTKFTYVTASKLAAFTSNQLLTNSTYSDTDIANLSLTAKTNGVTALTGANAINFIQPGVTGLVSGTSLTIGSAVPKAQTFTNSGTWTIPQGATFIHVVCLGGGGGGGSGTTNNTNAACSGGGGGGGGGRAELTFLVSDIPSNTVNITVGLGGGGAISPDAPVSGTNGGSSSFGSFLTGYYGAAGAASVASTSTAQGGGGGADGSAPVLSTGGNSGNNTASGGTGANSLTSGGLAEFGGGGGSQSVSSTVRSSGGSVFGGAGGGAGGAFDATATQRAGGAGGLAGSYVANGGVGGGPISGGAGTNGVAGASYVAGGGGSGGGPNTGGAAGSGGLGGIPGGGGGGGGSSKTSFTCGNGGNGGRGQVWVYCW